MKIADNLKDEMKGELVKLKNSRVYNLYLKAELLSEISFHTRCLLDPGSVDGSTRVMNFIAEKPMENGFHRGCIKATKRILDIIENSDKAEVSK